MAGKGKKNVKNARARNNRVVHSKTDHHRVSVHVTGLSVIVPPKGYAVILLDNTFKGKINATLERLSFKNGEGNAVQLKSVNIKVSTNNHGAMEKINLGDGHVLHLTIKEDAKGSKKSHRMIFSLRNEEGRRHKNPLYQTHSTKESKKPYGDILVNDTARLIFEKEHPSENGKTEPENIITAQMVLNEYHFVEYRKKIAKKDSVVDEKSIEELYQVQVKARLEALNNKVSKKAGRSQDPALMNEREFIKMVKDTLKRWYIASRNRDDERLEDYVRDQNDIEADNKASKLLSDWNRYYGRGGKSIPKELQDIRNNYKITKDNQSKFTLVVPSKETSQKPKELDANPQIPSTRPEPVANAPANTKANKSSPSSVRTRDMTF